MLSARVLGEKLSLSGRESFSTTISVCCTNKPPAATSCALVTEAAIAERPSGQGKTNKQQPLVCVCIWNYLPLWDCCWSTPVPGRSIWSVRWPPTSASSASCSREWSWNVPARPTPARAWRSRWSARWAAGEGTSSGVRTYSCAARQSPARCTGSMGDRVGGVRDGGGFSHVPVVRLGVSEHCTKREKT